MIKNIKFIVTLAIIGCLFFSTAHVIKASEEIEINTMEKALSYTGAELNDPIDGMWQGMQVNNDTKSLESRQEGISGDGKSVTFAGYQSGGNTQYAYTDMDEFHNKLIKTTMIFKGELPSIDASFLAFVFRAEGYSSKFYWDIPSYSLTLKSGQVEVQKHPAKYQSNYNNLGGTKGKTPIIVKLDEPFGAGTYQIEMGVIDGISPNTGNPSVNIIFRMNGKELVNVWDDSGRTPHIANKGYFMVCPIYTQEDVQSADKAESRSSVTFTMDADATGALTENTASTSSNTIVLWVGIAVASAVILVSVIMISMKKKKGKLNEK